MFGPINAIIFDLSGTLVKSTPSGNSPDNWTFSGVETGLEELKKLNFKLFICTRLPRRETLKTLEALNWLNKYFSSDEIRCSDDPYQCKPSGEAIQNLVKEYDLDLNKTLMVGDSFEDIEAGKAAGVKTAAALWEEKSSERYSKSRFKENWQRWDNIEVDLRILKFSSLIEWVKMKTHD